MISNELLKKKILELAMHGKLVQNDKNLNSVNIEEDINEGLYDIPKNWKWINFNKVFDIIGGSQPPKSKFSTELKEGYVRLYQTRDYGEKPSPIYVDKNLVNRFTSKGDILLARYGASLGKIFWAEEGAYNVAMVKIVFNYPEEFNKNYVFYYLSSSLYQDFAKSLSKMAQAGFNKDDLSLLYIPVPPLEEQKKISSKITELFKLIDKKDNNDRNKDNLKLILKNKILDYALRGQLIDNDLTLPALDIEEIKDAIPYEIPSNWKWSKLGKISNYGKNEPISGINIDDNGWMLELEDIESNTRKLIVKKRQSERKSVSSKFIFYKNDILYGKLRPYLNKCILADEDGFCSAEIVPLRFTNGILPKYMQYVMTSNYFLNYVNSCSYGSKMPRLGTKDAQNAMIPLPPLEEQRLIVEKIEKTFDFINKL